MFIILSAVWTVGRLSVLRRLATVGYLLPSARPSVLGLIPIRRVTRYSYALRNNRPEESLGRSTALPGMLSTLSVTDRQDPRVTSPRKKLNGPTYIS